MDPYTVQAEYTFRGENNDELCFKKGDIITVTQREDGGWWEGTLGDKTGWFPSNYVKEYKAPLPLAETIRTAEEIQAYRSVVMKDLLESERAHVAEIRGLLENFLEPLSTSQILTADEYAQFICNFVEIVKTHEELLKSIEDCNDRVGKLFLSKATLIKSVHQAYCAAHPRAIVILDKFESKLESFMENKGAASPGIIVLTTGLSKPFRRLDKYSAMLQELERHMESGHPDRGDTQRSISVYKDIASTCMATRRQKELELQVLTGPVRGWQGQELSTLGEIIHMGSVAVGPEHRDRYFVLFPETLLILSVSQRMSAFIYEGQLPLTGIRVNRLDDTDSLKNAFEVSGPFIEKIVAVCQGPNEANKWVDLLLSSSSSTSTSTTSASPLRKPPGFELKRNASSSAVNIPQPPPHKFTSLDSRGYCTRTSMCLYSLGTPSYQLTYPPMHYPSTAPYAGLTHHLKRLVKDGRLCRYFIKLLLYPEMKYKIDTNSIVLRKGRKTSSISFIQTQNAQESDDESSLTSKHRNRRNEITSETETEQTDTDDDGDCSSCASSSFGFIHFQTGKKSDTANSTDYETFIDYEADDRQNRQQSKIKSSITIDRDSDGSFIFSNQPPPVAAADATTPEYRDSLPIYSKPIKAAVAKMPSRDSIVHTSIARLKIGTLKPQVSETSDFGCGAGAIGNGGIDTMGGVGGANIAFHDLVNLEDSTQIKKASVEKKPVATTLEERHSMPTLFVGNRFNSSITTEVYIPSYSDKKTVKTAQQQQQQDEMENHSNYMCINSSSNNYSRERLNETRQRDLRDSSGSMDSRESLSTTTHSSSIDLPAIVPASDQLTAELLYNFDIENDDNEDDDNKNDDNDGSIIKPPSMFDCNRRISLNREISPFNKHQLNSDKKLFKPSMKYKDDRQIAQISCISQQQSQQQQEQQQQTKQTDPKKRCISYQFLKLNYQPKTANTTTTTAATTTANDLLDFPKKCACCHSSRCPSPRSSDSGVEGSCTISSPDPPKDSTDPNKIDQQFDMDYLDSISTNELRHSRSSHNFGRFNLIDFNDIDNNNDNDNHDSGQYGDSCSLLKDEQEQDPMELSPIIRYSSINPIYTTTTAAAAAANTNNNIRNMELSTSRETVKRKTRSQSAERSIDDIGERERIIDMSNNVKGAVYKTGLYAHWWKKENLPKAMLRDLIVINKCNTELAAKERRRDQRTVATSTTMTAAANQRHIGWGSGKINGMRLICF